MKRTPLRRTGALQRKTALKQGGFKAKPPKRKPSPPGRWRSSRGDRCAVCKKKKRRLTLHHVVYEQHVEKYLGDPWDPDDGLTACFDCHMGHHHHDEKIHVRHLRFENLRFAAALFSDFARLSTHGEATEAALRAIGEERAVEYISARYDGTAGEVRQRMDAALAAAA